MPNDLMSLSSMALRLANAVAGSHAAETGPLKPPAAGTDIPKTNEDRNGD